jgi:hypothetical protein
MVKKIIYYLKEKVMKSRNFIYPLIIVVALIFVIYGCTQLKGYGKIKVIPRHEVKISLQELKKNWQDYTIYYAGLSVGTAAGIMFDPKNDDKVLTGDMWIKIEDEETLLAVIEWIQTYIQFDPRLWRIVGPDDQFYGYLFCACSHVVIKSVDDTTMYVYDLQSPLYIDDEPRFRMKES